MRIFMSYSQHDTVVADKLSDALKAAGHKVWKWNETLKPGDNIAEKTLKGIEEADAFLLVVSANSLGSKWVIHEFSTLAMSELSKRDLRIIPVLIDQSPVPTYLSSYFYIDISKDIETGIGQVVASLRQEAPAATPSPHPETSSDTTNANVVSLSRALNMGSLTLVCGAGVSIAAGIPMWGDLLLSLLDSMIEKLSQEHSMGIQSGAALEFHKRYGASSLIVGKYLKNALGKDFSHTVRDALYSTSARSSEMVDGIVELSRPRREGKALDSIVTFNFDALIEENLDAARVPNIPIYTEAIKHRPRELPIYHVHGYLPRKGNVPEETEIVFSEDAYHGHFLDSFSWSNLIQLAKYSQNTCLFVGVSLTDPNLRRLLDVSWRKSPDKSRNHYIIRKLPEIGPDEKLNNLARLLEEQDANLLGMNVVWVRAYEEIPQILKAIAAVEA